MKYLTLITISLNIAGLLVVQLLEAWRPGSVAGLLSIGLLWCSAGISIAGAILLQKRS